MSTDITCGSAGVPARCCKAVSLYSPSKLTLPPRDGSASSLLSPSSSPLSSQPSPATAPSSSPRKRTYVYHTKYFTSSAFIFLLVDSPGFSSMHFLNNFYPKLTAKSTIIYFSLPLQSIPKSSIIPYTGM